MSTSSTVKRMLVPLPSYEFAHSTVVQDLMEDKRPILKHCGFISSLVERTSIPHPPRPGSRWDHALELSESWSNMLGKVSVLAQLIRAEKRGRQADTANLAKANLAVPDVPLYLGRPCSLFSVCVLRLSWRCGTGGSGRKATAL